MKQTFLIIFLLTSFLGVMAQNTKSDAGDKFPGEYQPGGTSVSDGIAQKKLELIKKNISVRLNSFEKGYSELTELDEKFKKADKVILSSRGIRYEKAEKGKSGKFLVIDYDDIPLTYEPNGVPSNLLKQLVYEFDATKLKSIKMVYDKRFFLENVYNVKKTITVDPGQVEGLNLIVEHPNMYAGKKDQTDFKSFTNENKVKTLKMLENQLLVSIFKIDGLKYIASETKDRKIEYQLGGL
ncbi:MAG: hypothetical protein SFU98_07655 [Leptospiraceae bacterium]|nr:hypothetical protein [Leptospiraceae bacterium]